MIEAIIIDDEQNNIEALQALLTQYCPDVEITGTAPDSQSGLIIIEELQPQLVFLDIEMPFGNGFDLLDRLSSITFEIIFVTAFNEYAIKAIKYAALDYILKPVNITELKNAVAKAVTRLNEKEINKRIAAMLENLKPENQNAQKIGLSTQEGIVFENLNNIIRLEAVGGYTSVEIINKPRIIVSRHLKEFEEILPVSNFFRIHNSHIINVNYLKKYFKGRGGYVEMEDGAKIEVSTRKKDAFLEKFRL
jgi:two-component system LytT family response regulator